MSDQNISATPYPFYATGGDDDSVQHAVLTSHAGASVERNQDSQFAALRSQIVGSDVVGVGKDARIETLEAKFEAEKSARTSDRHRDRQFAELKAELASMRSEGQAREIAFLRQSAQDSVNQQILAALAKLVK